MYELYAVYSYTLLCQVPGGLLKINVLLDSSSCRLLLQQIAHAMLESLSELNVDNIGEDDFTVECALNIKCGKAGGLDGLLLGHLKYGGPLVILWLKQIFNAFLKFEHIPPVSLPVLSGQYTEIRSTAIASMASK